MSYNYFNNCIKYLIKKKSFEHPICRRSLGANLIILIDAHRYNHKSSNR